MLPLVGCATRNESLAPRVDESTGETIVTMRDPVVLARPVPHLSVAARDYVYLGPVEVDRTGAQEFYLWLGMASTIDRGLAREVPFTPTRVSLFVDEQTLSFALTTWHEDASVSPYSVATPLYRSLRARVTLEDLERISRAQALSVELSDADGELARYAFWRGHMPEWTVLADDTGMGFTVEVQSPSRLPEGGR